MPLLWKTIIDYIFYEAFSGLNPEMLSFVLFDDMYIFGDLVKKSNVLCIPWPIFATYYQIQYHRNCFYE